MTPFISTKELFIVEIEVTEKIENSNLKSFTLQNLKLKNIKLENCEKLYINYVEKINEYQIFMVNQKFSFFEFEVLYKFYENRDFIGYELFICDNFFAIFKDKKLFYYQKIEQEINQGIFVEFLNKRFKIEIKSIKTISKTELEKLKKEFLLQKNSYKSELKTIKIKEELSFYAYLSYLILFFTFSYYFYETKLNIDKNHEEKIDIEVLKKRAAFDSFEEKFYEISKNIDKNSLILVSFDYRNSMSKITLHSKEKSNIDKFLEDSKNVISSTINFIEENKIFEVTIDVLQD